MRLVRMSELCAQLGVPRRTFIDWIKRDPSIATWIPGGRGGGAYWVRLDKLAGRHGIGQIDAHLLPLSKWIRASELARLAGVSRWTVQAWCRKRPGFAKRIGRNYWVDLSNFGASDEQIAQVLGGLVKTEG